MKYIKIICGLLMIATLAGCSKFLDREIESNYKEEDVFVNYDRIQQAGFGVYAFLYNRFGFSRIQNAMLASASDEADHAEPTADIQIGRASCREGVQLYGGVEAVDSRGGGHGPQRRGRLVQS